MFLKYDIREVKRPDGRTIWRIVEVWRRFNGELREKGIAALVSFQSAKNFCAELKRRYDSKL